MSKQNLKEETAAQASIKANGPGTKSTTLQIIMGKLGSMGVEDLNKFAESLVPPKPVNADAAHNQATLQTHPSWASAKQVAEEAMKEDVDKLLEGQELSEDLKEKTKTLFEAAVGTRVSLIEQELQEKYENALNEEIEQVTEQLVEKTDSYLNYVVEEWLKENEVAIETSVEADLARAFMTGLRQLFEETYVEMPEGKIDVVQELTDRVKDLEDKLNDSVNENVAMKNAIENFNKEVVIDQVAEGLTDTQVEKFKMLCENVSFVDDEDYSKKIKVVKETYFSGKKEDSKPKVLNEEVEEIVDNPELGSDEVTDGDKINDPTIKNYADAISRTTIK